LCAVVTRCKRNPAQPWYKMGQCTYSPIHHTGKTSQRKTLGEICVLNQMINAKARFPIVIVMNSVGRRKTERYVNILQSSIITKTLNWVL
jgi:hypothetical protein